MADIQEVLDERGKNYGNYLQQTEISQGLVGILSEALDTKAIDTDMNDAMMMICVKLSRIVNGNPWYADNWHDIAGYAKLVGDRLEEL